MRFQEFSFNQSFSVMKDTEKKFHKSTEQNCKMKKLLGYEVNFGH